MLRDLDRHGLGCGSGTHLRFIELAQSDDALAVHHLALDECDSPGIPTDEFHQVHDEGDEQLLAYAGGGPDVDALGIGEPFRVVDEVESRLHMLARATGHEAAPVVEAQLAPGSEIGAVGRGSAGKYVLVYQQAITRK